jgi:pimeloyl-ACP methyl ester carboxylesterase
LERVKSLVLANPYPQSLENQKRQFAVLETFDGTKDIEKISAHTFVMYGKEDIVSLPEESSFMTSKLKHAQLQGFKGGHGMIAEDSEHFANAIIRFFKD